MRVNREDLLKRLEAVSAGLAKREIIEQSQCFVFQKGKVVTFNDEVAAWMESPLGEIEGAVQAPQLLALLRKLPEDDLEVDVSDKDGEVGIAIKGKGRRSLIRMEKELLLPVDGVEEPGEWRDVPEELVEALKVAVSCCSTDESHFLMTCVHISPKFVESSDDFQIVRWPLKTGLKESTLIRRDSVQKVVATDPTQWSQTDQWLHFRSPSGLVLSCRRYAEQFPEVGKHLEAEGSEAKFPKGLDDALDRAGVFSSEAPEGNLVEVTLSDGRLRVKGKGPSGWYEERRKADYSGDQVRFLIDPKLLLEISRRSNKCVVGAGKITVDTGKFRYVACTAVPED
jgi:hypothetical protein